MMPVERLTQLKVGTKLLQLPVYFPSISSVKTALQPPDYLQILSSLVGLNNQFLVSAFDLANIEEQEHIVEILTATAQRGAITLMDSGNYESFWKDAQAGWGQANFHRALSTFPCDLAFGFDEQTPPINSREHIDLVVARWRADQEAAGNCLIIPIIHAHFDELPALCSAVAAETNIPMLAVAERKLGDGVVARARSVRAIRNELDKLDRYVALHLLGTGNPISIALYSAMGADSFDGLEWCQIVVDHDSALLYHLSQADFFNKQTAWGDAGLSFQAQTLAHNLEFYAGWMSRLRDAIHQGRVIEFCSHNLPSRIFNHCVSIFGQEQA